MCADTERPQVQQLSGLVVVRCSALRDADRSVSIPRWQRGRAV